MDKVFLGRRLIDFTAGVESQPFSRVDLVDTEGNLLFTAGDDTGRTLTATHRSATQAMADHILAQIAGYVYRPYDGRRAYLDPAAELGDGVTVAGTYVQLVSQDTTLSALFPSDISAPELDEIEDEFPYTSPTERKLSRQIKKSERETVARITKTDAEIRLLIENEINGLSSSFSVNLDAITARIDGLDEEFIEVKTTVDGLTVTDESGTTRIKGSSIETDTLHVKAANVTGTITASAISVKDAYGNNLLNAGGNAVKIATWNVDNNSFYSGNTFDASDVYLCTGSVGATSIAGSPYLENWVFKAGSHFGVQKDGTAYMSNAIVQGTVTANYGQIGPWKVKDVALYDGSALIYSGKALAAAETGDGSAIYLTPEYLFTQSTTGSDTVSVYARWSRIAALAQ